MLKHIYNYDDDDDDDDHDNDYDDSDGNNDDDNYDKVQEERWREYTSVLTCRKKRRADKIRTDTRYDCTVY
jgi:hypothetical protein